MVVEEEEEEEEEEDLYHPRKDLGTSAFRSNPEEGEEEEERNP